MKPITPVAIRPAMLKRVVMSRNWAISSRSSAVCAAQDKLRTMTSYRDAGVDIDVQDEALREVRRIARGTFTPNVASEIGSFGGLFRADFPGMENPILVSSTDGVGTKLRVAQAMKIHDTVGYDLVCHCV